MVEDGEAGRDIVVVVGRVGRGGVEALGLGDAHRNVVADAVELDEDVALDLGRLDVARLEADCVDEELLLHAGEGVVEEPGLGPVVVERRGE